MLILLWENSKVHKSIEIDINFFLVHYLFFTKAWTSCDRAYRSKIKGSIPRIGKSFGIIISQGMTIK